MYGIAHMRNPKKTPQMTLFTKQTQTHGHSTQTRLPEARRGRGRVTHARAATRRRTDSAHLPCTHTRAAIRRQTDSEHSPCTHTHAAIRRQTDSEHSPCTHARAATRRQTDSARSPCSAGSHSPRLMIKQRERVWSCAPERNTAL